MSEFNIEDLDAVIAQGREGSLAQLLALQLKSQIRKSEQLAKEREAFTVECAAAKIALKYALTGRRDFTLATPATDRIVAEAEARGIEKGIAHLEKKFSNIGVQIMNLQWLADSLREGVK